MRTRGGWAAVCLLGCGLACGNPAAFGANAVATYRFNNDFAADQGGAPALLPTDPGSTSVFGTDTVLGQSRSVWLFNGAPGLTTESGLKLNTTGLVPPESYSVEMVFKFATAGSGYRRLIDTHNLTGASNDLGLYTHSSKLNLYFGGEIEGPVTDFTLYHDVLFTDNGTSVNVYLDGVPTLSTTDPTAVQNVHLDSFPSDNPDRLLSFFLDNNSEWAPGSIALVRLWDGPLSSAEAGQVGAAPFAAIPEPATFGLLAASGWLLWRRPRR